ncbi:MAG TPA: CHC2 zinc finger domain-containing protein, partial [Ktedonobacteraceae bacterium]
MPNYAEATIDLVSLVEQRAGVSLVRRANHFKFGPEYWGPCPFCGVGDNRFHVWPEGDRPHYWCRVCGKEGSPAQFLADYAGLSYAEAFEELGFLDETDFSTLPPRPAQHYKPTSAPCKGWQEAGLALLERAERYLWHPKSPEGQQALAYLRGRGLCDATIKKFRYGYVPLLSDGSWFSEPFSHWGLDPLALTEQQRAKGCVKVPNGILIPWFADGQLWKLAVKRPGEAMDYGQVLGSADGLYNVDSIEAGKPVMLVEGEFDALSVQQEAGDLIACVATGSVRKGRSTHWRDDLELASYVLVAFDNDPPDEHGHKAGDEGAAYWLESLSHALRREPWAFAEEEYAQVQAEYSRNGWEWRDCAHRFKDCNEMLQYADDFKRWSGTDLRGWVQQGIEVAVM